MPPASALKVGRTQSGYVARVEGRGTWRESWALREFAAQSLAHEHDSLVLDLCDCEYLDSTFLGCMVDLHKRFGCKQPPRFLVAITPEQCLKLLAPTRLNTVLAIIDYRPKPVGNFLTISPQVMESSELGRHLMECHRRLAELGGGDQAMFAGIADQLARELEANQGQSQIAPRSD